MVRIINCTKLDTVWADFITGDIGRVGPSATLTAANTTGTIPAQRLPHPPQYALIFTDISLP